jgi:hypothetical protein
MIRAIALDIGGVLARIDKAPLHKIASPRDCDRAFFGPHFWEFQTGKIGTLKYLAEVKKGMPSHTVASLGEIFNSVVSISFENARALEGLNLPWFFLSNINEAHFSLVTSRLSLPSTIIKNSLVSYQIGVLKPHDLFFQKIAQKYPAQEVLIIDDKRQILVEAHRRGFATHHCLDPEDLPAILKR